MVLQLIELLQVLLMEVSHVLLVLELISTLLEHLQTEEHNHAIVTLDSFLQPLTQLPLIA